MLGPAHKWTICLVAVLREKLNPRNTTHMPAVKFSKRLDLNLIYRFLDEH